MNVFDYTWYRIAKLITNGIVTESQPPLSLGLGFGLLINHFIFLVMYYTDVFDSLYKSISIDSNGKHVLALTLSIVAYNYFRHRKMYWRLREKWKYAPKGHPVCVKRFCDYLGTRLSS